MFHHKNDRRRRRRLEEYIPNIDTPWGPFYFNLKKYGKYAYENLVDWYDDIDDPCDVTIETDAEDSEDVSAGLERFAQLMNNKENIDYQVKMTALNYLADRSGLIMSEEQGMMISKELFLDTMPLTDITLYRDGRTSFGFCRCDIPDVKSVTVLYNANGAAEVKVMYFSDNYYEEN